MRVSFAGELGWEIHSPHRGYAGGLGYRDAGGQGPRAAPLRDVRAELACGSRRATGPGRAICPPITRCCRAGWSGSSTGRSPTSAARRHWRRKSRRGVTKRFVTLTVAGRATAIRPTCRRSGTNGKVVGETTSAYWGHRVGACMALGMLRADLAVPGTAARDRGVRHALSGGGSGAMAPVWDAKNERIRA